MTFDEIIQDVRKGTLFRLKSWEPNVYLRYTEDNEGNSKFIALEFEKDEASDQVKFKPTMADALLGAGAIMDDGWETFNF